MSRTYKRPYPKNILEWPAPKRFRKMLNNRLKARNRDNLIHGRELERDRKDASWKYW